MALQTASGAVFANGEGDAWYWRNQTRLAAYSAAADPVYRQLIRSITAAGMLQTPIVDLGCSSGERLSALEPLAGSGRIGIDASQAAIAAAKHRDPSADWRVGDVAKCEIPACGALICSYVLHWIPRLSLSKLIDRITAAVRPGGLLVINDFYPDEAVDVPYHHLPDSGVMTHKRRYPLMFDGAFQSVAVQSYAYDGRGEMARVEVMKRV